MKSKISFELRSFLVVFIVSLLTSTTAIWLAHHFAVNQTKENFVNRYRSLSHVIGNTLFQMERHAELMMGNAAKVIQREVGARKYPSNEELSYLANSLNITHIFLISSEGNFVRSTNEDPGLIPNLFSFCDKYKLLLTGDRNEFTTPIIPPDPEPHPYKFMLVPSLKRDFIIELGLKATFIQNTLAQVLKESKDLVDIRLYAPDGTSLGAISKGSSQSYTRVQVDLNDKLFDHEKKENGLMRFMAKIPSSQPTCCQCDQAQLSRAGEYYYVLSADVSLQRLDKQMKAYLEFFLKLQGVVFLFCLVVARLWSARLVSGLKDLSRQVKTVKTSNDLRRRIEFAGKTREVQDLAQSFNEMLETLEAYQRHLLDHAKDRAALRIAREVAHDIKAPLSALKMILPEVSNSLSHHKILLEKAIERIEKIANDLMTKSKMSGSVSPASVKALIHLIQEVVDEKSIVYPKVEFDSNLNVEDENRSYLLDLDRMKRIISNILNNSVEACGEESNCKVWITLSQFREYLCIQIKDNGPGIDSEIASRLFKKPLTTKKDGHGVGLYSAANEVKSWGGALKILAAEGEFGCKLEITLKSASDGMLDRSQLVSKSRSTTLDC